MPFISIIIVESLSCRVSRSVNYLGHPKFQMGDIVVTEILNQPTIQMLEIVEKQATGDDITTCM